MGSQARQVLVPEEECRIVTAAAEAFLEFCDRRGGIDQDWYRVLKGSATEVRKSLGMARLKARLRERREED